MKTCPRCGRTEEEVPFIGFLCRDCYVETHEIVRIPKRLVLRVCPVCGRVYTDKWGENSMENISRWVARHVRTEVERPLISVTVREEKDGLRAVVLVRGTISGVPVQVVREFSIPVRYEQCPECARRAGGYYEAVIQLRGKRTEEMVDAVKRWVARMRTDGAYISKEIRKKEGVDIYVGSRKVAEKVARRVKKAFGAEMKRSFTLVTERNGKRIYRETILLRA